MAELLGAADMEGALLDSLAALREARGAINAANVYPVPDADTGTNLVMTFEAVARALATSERTDDAIARAIADGALHGARGNAGVMVAQVLRAWADGVASGPADTDALARMFDRASELATAAVLHPAPGTILTVLDTARAAIGAHEGGVGAALVAGALAARRALDETPKQLAVLARAGVVDAGGMGLVVVLDALARRMGGDLDPYVPRTEAGALACVRAYGPPTFRYEMQYMLGAPDDAIAALRTSLGEIGDSVAVIGGDGRWRVHVHTDHPDRARALGEAIGPVADVELVDFTEQIAQDTGSRGIPAARAAGSARLIAVAEGDGARDLFRSLGAYVVAPEADLADIVERVGRPLVVLPNDEEVFARAAPVFDEDPGVVLFRTSDMAQGVAVAVAYADGASFDSVAAGMREAFEQVRSGQVVRAPQPTDTPVGVAEEGDTVAIVDGEVVAIEADPVDAAAHAARTLMNGSTSVLTVLCGAEVDDEERARLTDALTTSFADARVEVHAAGQTRHRYLLSSE